MARKTTEVKGFHGRDAGKVYVITEMDAVAAEKWAWRATMALGRAGTPIPPEAVGMGMAAILTLGVDALLRADFVDAEPLLDEMLECVKFKAEAGVIRDRFPGDIEEVQTLLFLRNEVFELHTGFSIAAHLLKLGAAMKDRMENLPNTSTSPQPSELS